MPYFKYTARNAHGETVTGKVEAQTINQASALLQERALLVVALKPSSADEGDLFKSLFGIKTNEIVQMTRQLATMVEAGLPLVDSLTILAQESTPAMQKMLNDIVRSIEGGSTFSKALERQNGVFSKVYINLIRAGEAAGVLETVLNRLADSLEKQKEFAEKTKGALIYPIIVVITMIGVATMMMVVVVPKLAEMYRDLGAQLPLVTQIMIVISQIMIGYWWALIGVLAGSIALFNTWIRTKKGREKFERFLLWLPVFGVLRQKVILTEFCRTVSLLLGAGISMLQALEIVSDAIGNTLYHDSLVEMKGKIEKGVPLSQALADPEMYPMILKQMAAVGEETGKLDEVLFKLGKYFESESEHAIKNLTTAIEPMMMIVLGVGVGGLVVSIIMPIYNLSSVVK